MSAPPPADADRVAAFPPITAFEFDQRLAW
jgi:hypothetical protein